MYSLMSLSIASFAFSFLLFMALHWAKFSPSFFSTLSMCNPEAQMVMAGKGRSVTGLAVFFKVVTTYVVKA